MPLRYGRVILAIEERLSVVAAFFTPYCSPFAERLAENFLLTQMLWNKTSAPLLSRLKNGKEMKSESSVGYIETNNRMDR
jgi:hypothetical protein